MGSTDVNQQLVLLKASEKRGSAHPNHPSSNANQHPNHRSVPSRGHPLFAAPASPGNCGRSRSVSVGVRMGDTGLVLTTHVFGGVIPMPSAAQREGQ